MGMWAKIALLWSSLALLQLLQIKKKTNNNMFIARLPKPGLLKCKIKYLVKYLN